MLSDEVSPDPGALFSAFHLTGRNSVIAAVSGGGDSLALLFLLHDYLQRLPDAPSLIAVTIDHALRSESAAESAAVGRMAAAAGIPHRVLRWEGPKPATGVPAAARQARLSLLARAAEGAGTDLVLTGHTADDQAETLAMRLERGEGRGAAGMAPATLYDGRIWFARPLLEVRREALRVFLRARGISWMDDPTNRDTRFERARKRQEIDEHSIARLLNKARDAAQAREDAGRKAAALIGEAVLRPAPGLLRLRLAEFRGAEQEVAVYALRILLAVAGGTPHLPDLARARGILDQADGDGFRTSLSRAVIATKSGYLFLHRETRNLPEVPLTDAFVWDGRYRMNVHSQQEDLVVAAFGSENAREHEISDIDAPRGLVRSALAAEPAIWRDRHCVGLATECGLGEARPVAGLWAQLLPCFDLAAAHAIAQLLAGEPPPASPWRGHKGTVR